MDFSEKACLHVISNSVSIPNRTECLSDLIQTATSSEFCPSVTRLLVQDNMKTKNKRQNQLEKNFFNFVSFSLLSFEQEAIRFQTEAESKVSHPPTSLQHELPRAKIGWTTLGYSLTSLLFFSLFSYLPPSPPYPFPPIPWLWCERGAKNKQKGTHRSLRSLLM